MSVHRAARKHVCARWRDLEYRIDAVRRRPVGRLSRRPGGWFGPGSATHRAPHSRCRSLPDATVTVVKQHPALDRGHRRVLARPPIPTVPCELAGHRLRRVHPRRGSHRSHPHRRCPRTRSQHHPAGRMDRTSRIPHRHLHLLNKHRRRTQHQATNLTAAREGSRQCPRGAGRDSLAVACSGAAGERIRSRTPETSSRARWKGPGRRIPVVVSLSRVITPVRSEPAVRCRYGDPWLRAGVE